MMSFIQDDEPASSSIEKSQANKDDKTSDFQNNRFM